MLNRQGRIRFDDPRVYMEKRFGWQRERISLREFLFSTISHEECFG